MNNQLFIFHYLQFQFTSKVTLCEKTKWIKKINDSQEECINGYNVILEDTILFPEGGGQVGYFLYNNFFILFKTKMITSPAIAVT